MNAKNNYSLVAVRAFVAAARNQSFTKAAKALGVTQSAVSRHVAALESTIGMQLFVRQGPQVYLTPCGQQLFDDIQEAMLTIEQSIRRAAQQSLVAERLTIRTSMPSFSMKLIVPGLNEFTALSGLRVDLVTSLSAPQPEDDFDVLISRDITLDETDSWELVQEELICVASPSLQKKWANADPESPRPMVTARSRPDILRIWGSALPDATPYKVIATYDHLFFAIAAATGGTGFLVAPKLLVLDQLRDRTLVQADTNQVSPGARYVTYVNPSCNHIQAATEFCRWLKRRLLSIDKKDR